MTPEFLAHVVALAAREVGVREVGGPNAGPDIRRYLRSVRLGEGYPYCLGFVFCMFDMAAADFGIANPLRPRVGLVTKFWTEAPIGWKSITPARGAIFCRDADGIGPGTRGHCGIVEHVMPDDRLITIEANTNPSGARDGDGVYRRDDRTREYVNLGFVLAGVPG